MTVDAISDSGVEIWNLLEQRGIDNVILLGVHANMCVLGRPFGLRQMAKNGKNAVLMRDMTDTMYNPKSCALRLPFPGHRIDYRAHREIRLSDHDFRPDTWGEDVSVQGGESSQWPGSFERGMGSVENRIPGFQNGEANFGN